VLAVRLDSETELRLNGLAEQTGRSKSYYVKLAINSFLEEYEDYLIAVQRMGSKSKKLSHEEMRKRLAALED